MKYLFMMLIVSAFLVFSLQAQDRFDRSAQIMPDTLDNGGIGNIVAGVDFDNDGNVEMYVVNNNWNDKTGYENVPRIYKWEKNASGAWEQVWGTRLPLEFQNTWPALDKGDLDGDGRMEIIWGVVNNTAGGLQPLPERIVVFETPADGTDNMGVLDPVSGYWRPNAQWVITSTPNDNLRPFRWIVTDIDGDSDEEIVTSCRVGDGLQIYSVDDVPDAADSTETWTTEFSGLTGTFYDVAIIGSNIYAIQSDGTVHKVVAVQADSFRVDGVLSAAAGAGTWKSAVTVDVDNNGSEEVIAASWGSSDNGVYLLEESGDTLIATQIKDCPSTSGRLYGGAAGDLDDDGNLDFVFGTRGSTPNGIIHRLEYQGGAITDPNNWELTVMDQELFPGIQYDVIFTADVDDDDDDEVIYTGLKRGLGADDPPAPVAVLDRINENQPIIAAVADVPNDQGRQVWVIWQAAADDTMPSTAPVGGTIPVAIYGAEKENFPEIMINGRLLQPIKVGEENQQNTEQFLISQYAVWRIDAGQYPVQLATVLPIAAPYYAAVVPTLGDGEEWEGTFVVSAHTPNPQVLWKSFPKTGTSVDNLIPTAPTNLAGMQVGTNVDLTWDESPDTDFDYFSIRRGDQPGFDPNIGTEVGTTTDPFFSDSNVPGGDWFYRVVAFDFNGNEGEFSTEVSVPMGIEGTDGTIPREFALHQNYPNPFNPETWISFDLPKSVDVSITIYNTLGQKVRTLVSEAAPAGSYKVLWDGTNQNSVRVASGIYIYTIKAGTFVQSRKMTFMK